MPLTSGSRWPWPSHAAWGQRCPRDSAWRGLLHDLGKVESRLAVLTKPGKLTGRRAIHAPPPMDGAKISSRGDRQLDTGSAVAYEHHIMIKVVDIRPAIFVDECHKARKPFSFFHYFATCPSIAQASPYREGMGIGIGCLADIESRGRGNGLRCGVGDRVRSMMRPVGESGLGSSGRPAAALPHMSTGNPLLPRRMSSRQPVGGGTGHDRLPGMIVCPDRGTRSGMLQVFAPPASHWATGQLQGAAMRRRICSLVTLCPWRNPPWRQIVEVTRPCVPCPQRSDCLVGRGAVRGGAGAAIEPGSVPSSMGSVVRMKSPRHM